MSTVQRGISILKQAPITYPRHLGSNKKYLKHGDFITAVGPLKLFRAGPHHFSLLWNTFKDFYGCDTTEHLCGVKEIPKEEIDCTVYNSLRYPLTYFAINPEEEIVSLSAFSPRYQDPKKDPVPMKTFTPDSKDPLTISNNIYEDVLETIMKKMEVDRMIVYEATFTPTHVREQQIFKHLTPMILKMMSKTAIDMGFRYNGGLCVSSVSYKIFQQLGYVTIDTVSKKYKKLDGTPVDLPSAENPALIVVQDMVKVQESGLLERVERLWNIETDL